ncbi:hypothetical protein [Alteribacter natronophilus]|uniref:hypothetical protein n=1 Tax=Alteribacter natronophilus TaxID=2583810 RepID=UPI00110D5F37|nr:hypothetical protein [Alteribacter natronophilus]TMW72975.1 hypothetical protein FGB90_01305 [Alteribacter natronophilus]
MVSSGKRKVINVLCGVLLVSVLSAGCNNIPSQSPESSKMGNEGGDPAYDEPGNFESPRGMRDR